MKTVRSLILFLTLFIGVPSIAMDCDICYETIPVGHSSMLMCPNKVCSEAHSTCKECWLKHFKEGQCVYACNSTSECVICHKDFIKNGAVTDTRCCSLDCSHFVCYACIKYEDDYACSVCNRNHDTEAIRKIKSPRNSGEAKKTLEAFLLVNNKKQYPINNMVNGKKPVKPIAPVKPILVENCPICRNDRRVEDFHSIGCHVHHRYCIHCLPGILTRYHNCPACNQHINHDDRIRLTDEIARHKGDHILPSQKSFIRVGGLIGLSVFVLPWVAHYWSKYHLQSSLDALKHSAQTKTNTLLDFEFDGDNGVALLGLQESFDIMLILHNVTSKEKRIAIQSAVEQYDIALRNAYDRIVSTYYYQPVANFEQKEPQLVQELRACTEQINKLVTNYTQELGSPMRNMLLGLGAGALFGIGILQITKS